MNDFLASKVRKKSIPEIQRGKFWSMALAEDL